MGTVFPYRDPDGHFVPRALVPDLLAGARGLVRLAVNEGLVLTAVLFYALPLSGLPGHVIRRCWRLTPRCRRGLASP
jgi:hypothetical protein